MAQPPIEPVRKKTDHGPLDEKLKPDSPRPNATHFPNPDAAQDLDKKSDNEQHPTEGGV